MIKSRVEIKHFSIVGLMSPGWVRTQVRTHSDFCWTRGLGLGPTGLGLGLGLWSNGLGLGLWSNGLGLTPDGLGLWSYGLGLGLGLWPYGLGLTAGLTSPDSLQHWYISLNTATVWIINIWAYPCRYAISSSAECRYCYRYWVRRSSCFFDRRCGSDAWRYCVGMSTLPRRTAVSNLAVYFKGYITFLSDL